MTTFQIPAYYPISLTLTSDEIEDFHLARILLLLRHCGRKNRIAGLTKFAKLDFFVRYPTFFDRANTSNLETTKEYTNESPVESSMVRHHYGPWDKRYYHLLARLASTGLITVLKSKNTYNISLTENGVKYANELTKDASFTDLKNHMINVSKTFGGFNGTKLKNLIYETFEKEVAERPMGDGI